MKTIVLCTSRVFDTQIHSFIVKLNKQLIANDCMLLIFAINADIYWEEDNISSETTVFDIIPYGTADAVIIMDEKIKSRTVSERIIARAKKRGKPVIIVDGDYEGLPHIKYDYAKGFEEVVRHVLDSKPLKKPHMMAGIPGNPFSVEREEIFRRVIKEYGYAFDDSMISYGHFWARPAFEAAMKIVSSGEIPDAIICANDIMAINVCEVLRNNDLKVPEDVLLSGFDGYDEVYMSSPKITTVSCTVAGLADATADLVIKLIKSPGYEVSEEDSVQVVPELIPNESTGCKSFSGYDRSMLDRMNNKFYRYQDSVRLLHNIATNMQLSRTPDEMAACLEDLIINDQKLTSYMLFILNRKLFDVENYFFDQPDKGIVLEDYNVIYDIARSRGLMEMTPAEALYRPDDQCKYPLIFNSLDYMGRTLGFISFFFRDYDIISYSQTAEVTNTISMGIGGYVIMSYHRYLTGKMDEMYKHDFLTGLYNRSGFSIAFESIRRSEEAQGKPLTAIMCDLDGLKYINDNFGHAEGDNAIYRVAKALKEACPDDSLCLRIGGDELLAVIPGECDSKGIISKLEGLLSKYNKESGKDYTVSASCGSYITTLDDSLDIRTLFRLADERMYEVKKERHRKGGSV